MIKVKKERLRIKKIKQRTLWGQRRRAGVVSLCGRYRNNTRYRTTESMFEDKLNSREVMRIYIPSAIFWMARGHGCLPLLLEPYVTYRAGRATRYAHCIYDTPYNMTYVHDTTCRSTALLPLFLFRFSYMEIVHPFLDSTVTFAASICRSISLTINGMRAQAGVSPPR